MLTATELAQLRYDVEQTRTDTCQQLVYGAPAGGYGQGNPTYTAGVSEPCLFVPLRTDEAQAQVPQMDATLYLVRDSVITALDRVRITHLAGEAVTNPQTFEIVAGPILDQIMRKASLKLVTE